MKKFLKLTKSERNMLYKMRRLGYGFRAIGRELGRSHSTIIREISRNGLRGPLDEDYYTQAQRAHEEAHNRRVASSGSPGSPGGSPGSPGAGLLSSARFKLFEQE